MWWLAALSWSRKMTSVSKCQNIHCSAKQLRAMKTAAWWFCNSRQHQRSSSCPFLRKRLSCLGVYFRSMAQTSREWGTRTWWPSSRKAEMRPGCWWWTLRLTHILRRGGSFLRSATPQVRPDCYRMLKHNLLYFSCFWTAALYRQTVHRYQTALAALAWTAAPPRTPPSAAVETARRWVWVFLPDAAFDLKKKPHLLFTISPSWQTMKAAGWLIRSLRWAWVLRQQRKKWRSMPKRRRRLRRWTG